MEMYIMNESFEIIAGIDRAESMLWYKRLNEAGECEIHLNCSSEIMDILKMDYYVFRYDDDMVCKITDVKINTDASAGDYLTVEGVDICEDILSGRIILTAINYSGTVFNLIKRIIEENIINETGDRQITNFTFDDSNAADFASDIITTQLNYKNEVLKTIMELCKAYDYGFRLTYDEGFIFKLYKGADKSSPSNDEYVEFSDDYGNILNSNYQESKKGYKTVAIIGGVEAEDGSRLLVSIGRTGETAGIKRKEIFIDASSVKNNMALAEVQLLYPGGTVSGTRYMINGNVIANKDGSGDNYTLVNTYYEPLLEAYGTNILTQYDKSYAFEGVIDIVNTYDYKVDYNLGDKVKFINDYGIGASAEITEVIESQDENGYNVEPIFNYKEVDE